MTGAAASMGAAVLATLIAWSPSHGMLHGRSDEMPALPGPPIKLPRLPNGAPESRMLDACYGVTGEPMMRRLIDATAVALPSMLRSSEGCPETVAFLHAAADNELRSFMENATADLRRDLLERLEEALTDSDLTALLRFAGTPDAHRTLLDECRATHPEPGA